MTVHVNEIHTDIRPASEASQGPGSRGNSAATSERAGDTTDQVWRESRGRTEWLARRVAAEGFDD